MVNRYEKSSTCDQYLLFHYGSAQQQLPYTFGPHESLQFPLRCVRDCISLEVIPAKAQALDLGCAVGRSSFELSRYFERVVAVDSSQMFIAKAKELQRLGEVKFTIPSVGNELEELVAKLPEGVNSDRVEFICSDVMALPAETFDLVLAANILCRLPDPASFLARLSALVKPEGQLILITPFTWLEEFTPPSSWLTELQVLQTLQIDFSLQRRFDLPFLIREHLRKYDWGVSQAFIFRRI